MTNELLGKQASWLDTACLGTTVGKLIDFGLALILAFLLSRVLVRFLQRRLDSMEFVDKSIRGFMKSGVRIVLDAIALLIVLNALGVNMTSLVALLSMAGLAVSLSIQGLLGNFFSGLTLLATRPIAVDDDVKLGEVLGRVERISLIHTVLRTFDNRVVYIQNSDVCKLNIINYSKESTCRVEALVGASYDCDMDAVKAALLEAAIASGAMANPAPYVAVSAYQSSQIEYLVRVWFDGAGYAPYERRKFALTEEIRRAFNAHDIEMSYNHLNVHLL